MYRVQSDASHIITQVHGRSEHVFHTVRLVPSEHLTVTDKHLSCTSVA